MELSGLTSKLLNNADKLGMLAGALVPLNADGGVMNNILGAVERHDVAGAISWVTHLRNYTAWEPGLQVVKAAVIGLIASYGIKEFAPSNLSRYGTALEKGAWGALMGLPVAMFVLGLGRDPQPGSLFSGSSGGGGGSAGYGY